MTSSKYLTDTWLQCLYSIFHVENDEDLCRTMAHVGLIYTCGVGLYSLFSPAPYGRYQSSVFGPTMNAKLGWMMQECMSFFIPVIVILKTPSLQLRNFSNIVPLSLFMIHYFHSFIYPFATSGDSRPVPILTALSAALFTSYNGFLQGMHLTNVVELDDTIHGLTGTLLFITGMAINITHDRMLISLRTRSDARPSTDDQGERTPAQRYKIPRGGLFEYVSGANYLGEIIEWVGFALITRKYPQAVFALFAGVFLGMRAVHHHKFYRSTFGESYPQSRKAIIPFIL